MQIYDIIMLAVLLSAVVFGAWKGLAWQLASLCAIFVSYLVAYQFRVPVARYLGMEEKWEGIMVMLGLYLITSLVIWVVFGYIRKIIDRVKLQDFDRHAGAVLGAVKGVILCMIITLFAVTLMSESQKEDICCSYSGYFMAKVIDQAHVAMPSEVHDVLHPYLNRLDKELTHDHPGDHTSHDHSGSAESDHSPEQEAIEAARTAKKAFEIGSEIFEKTR